MALQRRGRRSSSTTSQSLIWPGFVDGLATLLVVLIFVLMVFFLGQTSLAQRVFIQSANLQELGLELSELARLLNLERDKTETLTLERQALQTALSQSQARETELAGEIAGLESQLAAARSEKQALDAEIARLTAEGEARRAELAETQSQLATSQAAAEASQAELAASRDEVLLLTAASIALEKRLEELQALLDEKTREAEEANEVSVNLARQLNDALSSKVVELTRFRSEFFGRLREVLQNRSDITIVGDRFVFQSEVLFALGSAEIGDEGKQQLAVLVEGLLDIIQQIPADIDWVLQIDGHTDNLPIRSVAYRDNWELSTARALSVVHYLVERGIPPFRLAAAGYGEFQPIDTANTDRARARNRRIEFKLTNPVGREEAQ